MYDIKNLGKLKRLDENNAEAMKAFWAFDKATFAPGSIDVLHRQLLAVCVALKTQCPYCIDLHVKAARAAGATDKMLSETATIAAAMRAGAAITHPAICSKTNEAIQMFRRLTIVAASAAQNTLCAAPPPVVCADRSIAQGTRSPLQARRVL